MAAHTLLPEPPRLGAAAGNTEPRRLKTAAAALTDRAKTPTSSAHHPHAESTAT